MRRSAIALLITVMFVILITVAIGVALKQVNAASQTLKNEQFTYQSALLLEDVLRLLQNSPDLARVGDSNSSVELFMLLSTASFIPFESQGFEVVIKLSSARSHFPINSLTKENTPLFAEYVSAKGVNLSYVDILLDCKSGIKEDRSYNSAIFEENPALFRDTIASKEHLAQINEFYAKTYNDNALANIAFEKLFSYSQEANASIDLNFATAEVWELLLGGDIQKAQLMVQNAGAYESEESLALSAEELERLKLFKTSFFEPVLLVTLEIRNGLSSGVIRFEYDIKKKKGSEFVYEI